MTGLILASPPQDDDSLWWAVRALWGVSIPRHQVCVDHVSPFRAFADAYFGRNSIDPHSEIQSLALWHGSRGLSGKSYMLAVLGLTKAVLLGSDVNLLGGSFEQSKNIHMHMRNSWDHEHAPGYMVASDGATEVRLTNKAKIRPLTASQRTVRGPHPPFLLLDEIDEMDIDILDAALGQPLPQRNWLGQIVEPYTVMCSTWQNPEGTFTEIMRRAEESGIPIYRWCYKETSNPIDGWLSEKAIAEKKAMIPKAMWDAEYDLNEPAIGNRAFDTDAVERAFCLPFEPIESREAKDFWQYTFEDYDRDGQYIVAADWGKEMDYTVILVGRVDVAPRRIVAYTRVNRRPWDIMTGYFNDAINRYNAESIHDGTGLGNVVADLIDFRARKFLMQGEKRTAMLSEYVAGIETDKWVFPKIPKLYSEMKYARYGDLYSNTMDYHLPDSVCAGGLLNLAAKRYAGHPTPVVIARDATPTRLQRQFLAPRDGERQAESPPAPEPQSVRDYDFVVG